MNFAFIEKCKIWEISQVILKASIGILLAVLLTERHFAHWPNVIANGWVDQHPWPTKYCIFQRNVDHSLSYHALI